MGPSYCTKGKSAKTPHKKVNREWFEFEPIRSKSRNQRYDSTITPEDARTLGTGATPSSYLRRHVSRKRASAPRLSIFSHRPTQMMRLPPFHSISSIMGLFRVFVFLVLSITTISSTTTQTTTNNRTTDIYVLDNATPDIVFIVPDRSTPYPNGLHNGILTAAYDISEQYTVAVRDYANFEQSKSNALLNEYIDLPRNQQPKMYAIWPMDVEAKRLVQKLYETHNVPIVQINQLPEDWEMDHLIGYAGPEDAERATNAGIMIVNAMKERKIANSKVVALGYPASYGGYPLSMKAFRNAIDNNNEGVSCDIVKELPLARPDLRQSAYNQMVSLIDSSVEFNGVYAMDDDILSGAYEALNDKGMLFVTGENEGDDAVTIVGTVCNGARELLENGKQYGTTIQAPFLESILAFDQVVEYLDTGNLTEKIRFTPNPIATGETWDSLVVEFLDKTYAADSICTWNQYHERKNGLMDTDVAQDACDWVDCIFVPDGLFIAGYVMVAINYLLIVVSMIMLYIHRKKKVILLAQPFFLALILLGAGVDTTSIIFMSRDSRNSSKEELDNSCVAFPWLLTLGQMLTTATLVAKIYRVKEVTSCWGPGQLSTEKTKVTTRDVSGFIIGGLAADLVILGIWYGTDPLHWTITVISSDFQDIILQAVGKCSSDGHYAWIYPMVIVMLHFCLLVYANILAFQTRRFHKISDSKMAAVSVFNSIQLLILATIMVAMSGSNVSIDFIIKASYAFLNNFGVIALMVLPKLYLCYKNDGQVRLSFHRTNSSTTRNRPASQSSSGCISGLGDISHIDRKSLVSKRFSEEEIDIQRACTRPSTEDIASRDTSDDHDDDNINQDRELKAEEKLSVIQERNTEDSDMSLPG